MVDVISEIYVILFKVIIDHEDIIVHLEVIDEIDEHLKMNVLIDLDKVVDLINIHFYRIYNDN